MKVYLAKTAVDEGLTISPYNGNAKVDNPKDIYNPDDPKTEQRTNQDYFKNRRSQKYWELRDRFQAVYNAIEKGIYTDPDKLISISSKLEDLDVLKSELVKVKRVKGNNNKVQIQSKKDAIKEGIKSPNMADALKMCFANPPLSPKPITLNFTSEF
jgi:phage terminase large subunit